MQPLIASTQLVDREDLIRFQQIADNLPILIWMSGIDKLCTWFNKTWLSFVGRTMEQELGNGWAENVFPEDFDRCLETYITSFDARQPFRMDYRLRHHTGAYRWILDEGIPLYDASREFIGYIGCCLDITEQKRAEASLLQANADLEAGLERERRITHTLQSAFLPPFLPKVKGVAFQGCYRPAEADTWLGGDWYDVFVLSDGRIALSIGDVLGHGLEAAGAMVRLRERLRAVTGFVDDDPAHILQLADRALQELHPEVIASAILAIYDPETRRIRVANAGHPQPALVRNGTAKLLEMGDVLLGVTLESAFSVHEHVLKSGDTFILYTDGLIEVERDVLRGERQLLRVLEDGPIEAEAVVRRIATNKQHDDIAMLVLAVTSVSQDPSVQFQADETDGTLRAMDL